MSKPVEGEIVTSKAQEVLKKLELYGDKLDNLVVAFSLTDRPSSIIFGSTPHTSTLWALGALDYCRWHMFNAMSAHQFQRETDMARAILEAAQLREEGGLDG